MAGALLQGHLGVRRKRGVERRYFVLCPDELLYFTTEADATSQQPRGRLILSEVEGMDTSEDSVTLHMPNKNILTLEASEGEPLVPWINALREQLEEEPAADAAKNQRAEQDDDEDSLEADVAPVRDDKNPLHTVPLDSPKDPLHADLRSTLPEKCETGELHTTLAHDGMGATLEKPSRNTVNLLDKPLRYRDDTQQHIATEKKAPLPVRKEEVAKPKAAVDANTDVLGQGHVNTDRDGKVEKVGKPKAAVDANTDVLGQGHVNTDRHDKVEKAGKMLPGVLCQGHVTIEQNGKLREVYCVLDEDSLYCYPAEVDFENGKEPMSIWQLSEVFRLSTSDGILSIEFHGHKRPVHLRTRSHEELEQWFVNLQKLSPVEARWSWTPPSPRDQMQSCELSQAYEASTSSPRPLSLRKMQKCRADLQATQERLEARVRVLNQHEVGLVLRDKANERCASARATSAELVRRENKELKEVREANTHAHKVYGEQLIKEQQQHALRLKEMANIRQTEIHAVAHSVRREIQREKDYKNAGDCAYLAKAKRNRQERLDSRGRVKELQKEHRLLLRSTVDIEISQHRSMVERLDRERRELEKKVYAAEVRLRGTRKELEDKRRVEVR